MRLSVGILVKLVIFVTLLFGVVNTEVTAAEGLARTENVTVDRAVGQEFLNTWKVLKDTPLRFDVDGWLPRISSWLDEGLQVGVKETDGVLRIFGGGTNPLESGLEIARISQKNGDEVIEILEDGFLPLTYPSSGAIVSSKAIDLPVVAPCQSAIPNVSLARMTNGQIGFMADVSNYASLLVRKALTSPYHHLRKALQTNGLISAGQQAHHVIPIELLRKNEVVQDAVEAGFDFNGLINGKGLRSVGENPIHLGSHDKYNSAVENVIAERINPLKQTGNYSATKAKDELEKLANELKELMETMPNTPVNLLFD